MTTRAPAVLRTAQIVFNGCNSQNAPCRGILVEGDDEVGLSVGPIRMEDGGEYR